MNTYERMELFGRRTRFALLADALLYGTILWITLLFLLRGARFGALAATLFSLAACAIAWMLAVRYSKKARRRLRSRVREELALQNLMLEDESRARERFQPDAVLLASVVRRDDLLSAIRSGTKVLWLCGEPDADAKAFLLQHPRLLDVRSKDRTAAKLAQSVSMETVEAELLRRSRKRKKLPALRELMQRWRPNRFTLLGVLLMGLSFLTNYPLYYRIVASVCFMIGSFLYTRAIVMRAQER